MSEGMTKEQIHILQHSLGIADGKRVEYRNYYAVEDGNADCEALVSMGLMFKGRGVPGYDPKEWPLVYYHLTDAGKQVARDNLPAEPKTTRAQRRYQKWLDLDGVTGLKFGEWLKTDMAREVR